MATADKKLSSTSYLHRIADAKKDYQKIYDEWINLPEKSSEWADYCAKVGAARRRIDFWEQKLIQYLLEKYDLM